MSSKIRFILDNFVDTSTIEASPDMQATLPVSNLQKISRSTVTQSTSTADQEITGVFSNAKDVSAIVVGRHNLITNCTWQVILYSDVGLTTAVHTSDVFIITADQSGPTFWAWGDFAWGSVPWGSNIDDAATNIANNLVYWIVDSNDDELLINNVKGFRIILKKGTATAINYFELGRLMIGNFIEPTYNISYGHGLSWTEKTKQYRTELGSLRSDRGIPYRKFEFNLNTISEADRVVLQVELANVGLRSDIFLSFFPCNDADKGEHYSGIVKMTKIPKFTEFQSNWYRSKYVMEEV